MLIWANLSIAYISCIAKVYLFDVQFKLQDPETELVC